MRALWVLVLAAAGAAFAAAAADFGDGLGGVFTRAPAYNKRVGFNVSFKAVLDSAAHSVQQLGPNWHIRVHGDGELSYDPVRIHLSADEAAALDADVPQYVSTHTIRDGDHIVAAGGIPLASHSFKQAVSEPGFFDDAIKSRLRNTLFPVFEKHGATTDRIQGYVQARALFHGHRIIHSLAHSRQGWLVCLLPLRASAAVSRSTTRRLLLLGRLASPACTHAPPFCR
jgi:hypothetical protein